MLFPIGQGLEIDVLPETLAQDSSTICGGPVLLTPRLGMVCMRVGDQSSTHGAVRVDPGISPAAIQTAIGELHDWHADILTLRSLGLRADRLGGVLSARLWRAPIQGRSPLGMPGCRSRRHHPSPCPAAMAYGGDDVFVGTSVLRISERLVPISDSSRAFAGSVLPLGREGILPW